MPHVKYAPTSSFEEKNLADGVWYLHIRFEDKNGLGDTTHFRFQIDTVPPLSFEIKFPNNSADGSGTAVSFNTSDPTSGIGGYGVKIDDAKTINVEPEVNTDPLVLPSQRSGTHAINITAYDLAGNSISAVGSFTVPDSYFIKEVKTFTGDAFWIGLLLLILAGIYFLILRSWHGLTLLQSKLKNEIREVSKNRYSSLRDKVDNDFFSGKYLDALFGYRKLQEQTPADKQPELNERITLVVKFFIASENFKRASVLASHAKWQDALILLQESEYAMDQGFIYHQEAKQLYGQIEEHLAQVVNKKKIEQTDTEKKIIEIQNLAQENKEKLIEEHSLLVAEKDRRGQLEADNSKLATLLKEKELFLEKERGESEIRLKEKELAVRQALENADLRIKEKEVAFEDKLKNVNAGFEEKIKNNETHVADLQRKIDDTLRLVEEGKIKLTEEQGLLVVEKTKREQVEDENKKMSILLGEKEASIKEAVNKTEQVKIELTEEKDLLQAEKNKGEELEREIMGLQGTIKNNQIYFEQSLAQAESRIKNKEVELKKSLEESDRKMQDRELDFKKLLTETESKVRDHEATFKKSLEEAESKMKNKEAEFKKSLEESDTKIKDREIEFKKDLEVTESKAKGVEMDLKKDVEKVEAKMKEMEEKAKAKEVEFKKNLEVAENKMKDKEASLKKIIDNSQKDIDVLKEKLDNADRLNKETKKQLVREQELLVQEKAKAQNLLGAISKFINPDKSNS